MLAGEGDLSRAELDRDYTARDTVCEAEFARIMGLYQSLSDKAHALPHGRLGLEFCTETGLQMDLFGTVPGEKRPVMVFIHGGYWRALSRGQSAFAAPMLAARGIACAVPDYRWPLPCRSPRSSQIAAVRSLFFGNTPMRLALTGAAFWSPGLQRVGIWRLRWRNRAGKRIMGCPTSRFARACRYRACLNWPRWRQAM